jgi:hypothetical protein
VTNPQILRIAFGANIAILVPVCWSMFFGDWNRVFDGAVAYSSGLRLLVGSLWTAILVASMMGLLKPEFFAPVLLIQVFYKAMWLLTFVLPTIRSRSPWPTGISVVFLFIVVTYPVIYWSAS